MSLAFLASGSDGAGAVELRGEVDALPLEPGEELVRLTPRRALVLRARPVAPLVERARAVGLRAYDLSAGLTELSVAGEPLLRRLTELDLGALPAVGPIARGVPAVMLRGENDSFRVLVPQELARYVREVVSDLEEDPR